MSRLFKAGLFFALLIAMISHGSLAAGHRFVETFLLHPDLNVISVTNARDTMVLHIARDDGQYLSFWDVSQPGAPSIQRTLPVHRFSQPVINTVYASQNRFYAVSSYGISTIDPDSLNGSGYLGICDLSNDDIIPGPGATLYGSSRSGDGMLTAFDLSDPFVPKVTGSVNTVLPIRDLWFEDPVLYLQHETGIRLMDVTNPTHPEMRSVISFRGHEFSHRNVSASGAVILVEEKTYTEIWDVSDPMQPALIFTSLLLDDVNWTWLSPDRSLLLMANPDELTAYNISNPDQPVAVWGIQSDDNDLYAVTGEYLYQFGTTWTIHHLNGFEAPEITGSLELHHPTVRQLVMLNPSLFLECNQESLALYEWQYPQTSRLAGAVDGDFYSALEWTDSMIVAGSFLGITTIDISDIHAPEVIGTYTGAKQSRELIRIDSQHVVSISELSPGHFSVLDLSDPQNPVREQEVLLDQIPADVFVAESILYILDHGGGVSAHSTVFPYAEIWHADAASLLGISSEYFSASCVYVPPCLMVALDNQIAVFRLSQSVPHLTLTYHTTTESQGWLGAVRDETVVMSSPEEIRIYDMIDPANPRLTAFQAVNSDHLYDIDFHGDDILRSTGSCVQGWRCIDPLCIDMAGWRVETDDGSVVIRCEAQVRSPDILFLELAAGGLRTGLSLNDDGINGDRLAGDQIYTWEISLGIGPSQGNYLAELVLFDRWGRSVTWPGLVTR